MFMRCLLLAFGLLASSCAQEFQNVFDKGEAKIRDSDWVTAAEYFERAVALKPNSVEAHRRLALVYLQQYIPGVSSPDNSALGQKAEAHARKVLDLAPGDKVALAFPGQWMFFASMAEPATRQGRSAKLDQAKDWIEKLRAVDPQDSEVF